MINPISQYNLTSLLNQSFGGSAINSSSSIFSSSNLFSSLSSAQSGVSALQDRQAFNLSELSLRTAASALNATNSSSVFNTTSAVSSNANKVTATANSTAKAGTYSVAVTQLAQGTQIQGSAYVGATSAATSGLVNVGGFNQMDVTVGGVTSSVTVDINGTETNDQALGKIAGAINSRVSGVTATVTTDATGNSKLSVVGPTGSASAVSVTDTLGNAAAYTGIDNPANVTKTAQNAAYSVNGNAYSASTNKPTLTTEGLTLNLTATTGATNVDITVGSDGKSVESGVRAFVSQYNDTLSKAQGNTASYSQQSAGVLKGLVSVNASALGNIGVDVGTNGKLSINESKFTAAVANNPDAVNKAFNGGSRLAASVQNEADRAINSSLTSSAVGGFSSFYGQNNTYGSNLNNLIAGSLGLFFNKIF